MPGHVRHDMLVERGVVGKLIGPGGVQHKELIGVAEVNVNDSSSEEEARAARAAGTWAVRARWAW